MHCVANANGLPSRLKICAALPMMRAPVAPNAIAPSSIFGRPGLTPVSVPL
jgi:hypothetical protein